MSYDVFGDLQEWGRVLDQVQKMRQDGILDNPRQGLARLARYPFNWQLRQAALRAIAELKRPTDEILQIAVQIMVYDHSDLETRILAGNAVSGVLGNGGGARLSDSARSDAAKSIRDLLDTPQPPRAPHARLKIMGVTASSSYSDHNHAIKEVRTMQATASVSRDDERRVLGAQDGQTRREIVEQVWPGSSGGKQRGDMESAAGGRRLSPTRFLAMSEQVQLVTEEVPRDGAGDGGGIVANIEKHLKHPMEQIDQADFSEVPTCGRSSRLIGRYIKNRQDGAHSHVLPVEDRPRAILVLLENTPATPANLERIRERVRALNRRLADSGTPFRLRVV